MTREIRILHTADTHLGYRQYHSDVRRQDFFKAFEAVVRDAIEMQVDVVVHAGDFFDSRTPTLEDVLESISIITPLRAAGIPLLGIVGNHESKQNMQWLDLFEKMGIALRLGKKPYLLGEAAIYGIDSVPKSKIPTYDYSGFEIPSGEDGAEKGVEEGAKEGTVNGPVEEGLENRQNLVVMHQLMNPFPYGEWACEEVIENLPFRTDAILLGDYHKYEKIKVGETWVTYPGSTERNSASEREPRSYNIITLREHGLEISRRNIETRKFLFITVNLKEKERPYEQIFSAVDEYGEELAGSVVFVEISGDVEAALSFSEIEEYVLNKGALVPRIKDIREMEALPPEEVRVSFSDPDRAVAEEIKKLNLTDGGLIIDEIVRSPLVSKTNVDSDTENRIKELIEKIDFKAPDFRLECGIPENSEVVESEIREKRKIPNKDTGMEAEKEESRPGPKQAESIQVEPVKPATEETGIPESVENGTSAELDEISPESISPESFLSRKAADLRGKSQPEIRAAGKEKEEMEEAYKPEKMEPEPKRKEKKTVTPAPRQRNFGDYL